MDLLQNCCQIMIWNDKKPFHLFWNDKRLSYAFWNHKRPSHVFVNDKKKSHVSWNDKKKFMYFEMTKKLLMFLKWQKTFSCIVSRRQIRIPFHLQLPSLHQMLLRFLKEKKTKVRQRRGLNMCWYKNLRLRWEYSHSQCHSQNPWGPTTTN